MMAPSASIHASIASLNEHAFIKKHTLALAILVLVPLRVEEDFLELKDLDDYETSFVSFNAPNVSLMVVWCSLLMVVIDCDATTHLLYV